MDKVEVCTTSTLVTINTVLVERVEVTAGLAQTESAIVGSLYLWVTLETPLEVTVDTLDHTVLQETMVAAMVVVEATVAPTPSILPSVVPVVAPVWAWVDSVQATAVAPTVVMGLPHSVASPRSSRPTPWVTRPRRMQPRRNSKPR